MLSEKLGETIIQQGVKILMRLIMMKMRMKIVKISNPFAAGIFQLFHVHASRFRPGEIGRLRAGWQDRYSHLAAVSVLKSPQDPGDLLAMPLGVELEHHPLKLDVLGSHLEGLGPLSEKAL